MKELYIPRIEAPTPLSLTQAEYLLEQHAVSHAISCVNWDDFDYAPQVNFRIAHTGQHIWLKYTVNESHIRAMVTETNGPVYQDSCVEFFISFGEGYYNFEFNCIGVPYLATGPNRFRRRLVEPNLVEQIAVHSTLGNQPFDKRSGAFEWELMISIPISCFVGSNLTTFDDLAATANLYKCGDETEVPHFLSWNPIDTPNPDFHRSEFFGKVQFG